MEINLRNKIEMLEYKILNGMKDGSNKMNGDGDNKMAENTFKELLTLCMGEIKDITKKQAMMVENEKSEDQLRNEIIMQGRKMNELRSEHEQ